MPRVVKAIATFGRKDDGATMVEYGLMLALIALVCFAVVQTVGVNLNTVFDNADLKNAL